MAKYKCLNDEGWASYTEGCVYDTDKNLQLLRDIGAYPCDFELVNPKAQELRRLADRLDAGDNIDVECKITPTIPVGSILEVWDFGYKQLRYFVKFNSKGKVVCSPDSDLEPAMAWDNYRVVELKK